MAHIKKVGSLGLITGKVGDVVCSSWKGKPYVKSAPGKRKPATTEKEMANRNKWAMAQAWLKPVTEFVREGFRGYSPTVEGFIAAKSYLLKNAFEGVAPDSHINPALVKVSFGELPLPQNMTAMAISNKDIQFTWDTGNISTEKNKYDQAMLLAYDIEHGRGQKKLIGELRKTGADTLRLHAPANNTYHLYIAFVAADRMSQSDSVYLGTVSM